MVTIMSTKTGSQKVEGSNPSGSTNKPKVPILNSENPGQYLSGKTSITVYIVLYHERRTTFYAQYFS